MDESQHSQHKNALGKLYEKFLMAKRLGNDLDVVYAFNTETKRTEVVLTVTDEKGAIIPLASLWSAPDVELRVVQEQDSVIISRMFKLYEVEDDRQTIDEFNNEYHPKDKNYDDMWKFVDSARQALEEELGEEIDLMKDSKSREL